MRPSLPGLISSLAVAAAVALSLSSAAQAGSQSGCTGYPLVADVNFYNPMQPFGPQTVDICRGGHVTFHNISTGTALVIDDLTSPGGQPLFPQISLPGNGANGSTGVLQTGTPISYHYKISGFTVHGHIRVH